MADYGYYKSEKHSAKRERPKGVRRGLLLTVTDAVMFAVTVAAALVLLLALFSKWIDPRSAAVFAFLGLFYPIIYLVNIFCALWWVIRWRKAFFISFAILLLGLGNVKLFYRPDLKKQYQPAPVSRNDITVVSYNVMNFSGKPSDADKKCKDLIADWINNQNAQVVCIQEAYFKADAGVDDFMAQLSRIGYSFFRNANTATPEADGSGVAIFSTYPIIRSGVVDVDSIHICSVWTDLKIGRDTLRVVCNHLQSTAVDEEDKHTTLTPQILDDTLAREKLMGVARKMAQNYRRRAAQGDILSGFIAASPYPTVVCGDFNDTPMSYVYHEVRRSGLKDAFIEAGHGMETTYKGLFNLFRIDYVLVSDELAVKEYRSEDVDMSDHKPLAVRIELRQ